MWSSSDVPRLLGPGNSPDPAVGPPVFRQGRLRVYVSSCVSRTLPPQPRASQPRGFAVIAAVRAPGSFHPPDWTGPGSADAPSSSATYRLSLWFDSSGELLKGDSQDLSSCDGLVSLRVVSPRADHTAARVRIPLLLKAA